MFSRRSFPLALTLVGALALGLAACAGGDDDDATPTPVPYAPDQCVIDWIGGTADNTHVYRLILSAGEVGGTSDYSDVANVSVISAYGLPTGATSLFQAKKLTGAKAGAFDTTAAGLQDGDTVSFDDTTAQSYFLINTADFTLGDVSQGSAGVGSFNGEWTPHPASGDFLPDSDEIVAGTGSITMVGTASIVTVTGNPVFGWCIKDVFFAPSERLDRLMRAPVVRPQ